MAPEEIEYFAPTVNRSAAGRPIGKEVPAKAKALGNRRQTKKDRRSEAASSALRPFVQGITLGAVLMIPFGVWWWAQHPPIAVGTTGSPEAQAAVSAKAKQGKQAIVKKKPFRPAAIAPLPRIVPKVEDAEVRTEVVSGQVVVPETLPTPVALATEIPVPVPDATNTQPPKKGVLKTIVSPFQKLKSKAKITGIEE